MWYTHPDVETFVKYVSKNYECTGQDVRKVINDAYNEQYRVCQRKRTKKVKEELLQEVLSNCRAFLIEDRKEITSADLVFFRLEKNYFNCLKKRN